MLDHINIWLIDDGDSWVLVDTWLIWTAREQNYETLFAGIMDNKPISRVLVTHMHPTMLGGRLAGKRFDAEFYMSRTDYLMCRAMAGDTGLKRLTKPFDFITVPDFLNLDWRATANVLAASVSIYSHCRRRITASSKMMSWRLAGASGGWKLADTRPNMPVSTVPI